MADVAGGLVDADRVGVAYERRAAGGGVEVDGAAGGRALRRRRRHRGGTGPGPAPGRDGPPGRGTALPGLHDHHLHLLAMAAAADSVDVGADQVTDSDGLGRVLGAADATLARWWVAPGRRLPRAGPRTAGPVGHSTGSSADRPLRVQHRSGHLWVLNSGGLPGRRAGRRRRGPAGRGRRAADGIERDATGRATVGSSTGTTGWPGGSHDGGPRTSARSSRRLASYGVTGVTDATPTGTTADLEALAAARRVGRPGPAGAGDGGLGRRRPGGARRTGGRARSR